MCRLGEDCIDTEEAVLIQFVSPDDEHDVLVTCRAINRNKYIEKNLCITLVIYKESYRIVGVRCHFLQTYHPDDDDDDDDDATRSKN